MSGLNNSNPRIVICGTGQYGCFVSRIALDHGYEIVAAFNRGGPKVGQDLGKLAGLDREIGVIVQDIEKSDFNILDADVGIVTQTNNLRVNLPTYKKLIEAGINVLCHGVESYYPFGCDPEVSNEIDILAKRYGVTFSGSGIWDMSRIWAGILLAGQCTHINSIYHRSLTKMEGQGTRRQLTDDYCVGRTVDDFYGNGLHKIRQFPAYTQTIAHVLTALGFSVTETRTETEPVILDEDFYSDYLNCLIPAGRVIGIGMEGYVETKEGVTGKIDFEARITRPGEEDEMFWKVDGKPGCELTNKRKDSNYMTACCVFNRIKDVIAAKPGIVLVSQMGPTHAPELLRAYQ